MITFSVFLPFVTLIPIEASFGTVTYSLLFFQPSSPFSSLGSMRQLHASLRTIKLGVVIHACNPSTLETEAGRL
jgi:hypothetical protein